MKFAVVILVGLFAVSNANFFDGVKSFFHDAGQKVVDAVHSVTNSLAPVATAALDGLKTAAPSLLQTALQTGLQALPTLLAGAAGKRSVTEDDLKTFIEHSLHEEYQKWLSEIETQIKGSKQELEAAIEKYGIDNLPQQMKDYVSKYIGAHLTNNVPSFIKEMAEGVKKEALAQLPKRLNDKMASILSEIKQHL